MCLDFTFAGTLFLLPVTHKSRDSSIKLSEYTEYVLQTSLNISVLEVKVSISKYSILYFVDNICKQSAVSLAE